MNPQTIILLTVMLVLIAAIIALIAFLRMRMHRRRVALLQQRRDDQVHYAFIINPSKPAAAQTRQRIEAYCKAKGLTEVVFIETMLDKDGRVCALEALDGGADVVIATGNLFARNMGIPLDDIEAALTIAVSHGSRRVDLGRVNLLDDPTEDHGHAFLIIAGIGFDAVMIDDTDPNLKRNFSWLAYFFSGAKHLFAPKYHAEVRIEAADHTVHTDRALELRTFMAGNCGEIPVFSLMPDASFNDGLLDFEVIDTTGGLLGWANLFGDVVHQTITKKAKQSPLSMHSKLEQMQGYSAEVRLDRPVLAQVDGDMLPSTQHLRFSVEPEALIVRVPLPDPEQLSATAQMPAVRA